jgi:hypothetical protein
MSYQERVSIEGLQQYGVYVDADIIPKSSSDLEDGRPETKQCARSGRLAWNWRRNCGLVLPVETRKKCSWR